MPEPKTRRRAPAKAKPRPRAKKPVAEIVVRPAAPGFVAFVDAWNALQNQTTPSLHTRIAAWLEGSRVEKRDRLVLLAFRSSGKSTLVGLFCAWLFACDPDLRVLVLAATHALARKMVRNVKRIVERHQACAGLKPVKTEQWAADQFIVARQAELRDPSMVAKGMLGNVTGSRADIVICDDVEVPNNCDTAAKREDLRERLHEIEYVIVPGGLQLISARRTRMNRSMPRKRATKTKRPSSSKASRDCAFLCWTPKAAAPGPNDSTKPRFRRSANGRARANSKRR